MHGVMQCFCNSACQELHRVLEDIYTVKQSYTELKMILDGCRNFANSRMHLIWLRVWMEPGLKKNIKLSIYRKLTEMLLCTAAITTITTTTTVTITTSTFYCNCWRNTFYRPDVLPVTQPKHWTVNLIESNVYTTTNCSPKYVQLITHFLTKVVKILPLYTLLFKTITR